MNNVVQFELVKRPTVILGGHAYRVSPIESRILECLAEHEGETVPYSKIYHEIWGDDPDGGPLDISQSLGWHVFNIRQRVGRGAITTIWGLGLRFNPAGLKHLGG